MVHAVVASLIALLYGDSIDFWLASLDTSHHNHQTHAVRQR